MPSRKPDGTRLNGGGSKWITKKRRLAVYLRDAFTCAYCARSLVGRAPRELSLDHIVPVAKGGGHESENLVTACADCNGHRQHRRLERRLKQRVEAMRYRPLPLALAAALLAGRTPRGAKDAARWVQQWQRWA